VSRKGRSGAASRYLGNRMRPTRLIAGLLAAAAIVLPAGSAAAKVPTDFWGVSLLGENLDSGDLARMHKGNVTNARFTFFWQKIEPNRGSYLWGPTDKLVGDLASRGIESLPTVYGTPSWAAKSDATAPVRSRKQRRGWKTFLEALVARYGPGGDYWTDPSLYPLQHPASPPVPLRSWQVWNEPTIPSYYKPKPSVKGYTKLLRISHKAIKTGDPSAKVILAGLFGYAYKPRFYAWHFLSRLYRKHGIKRDFDAVNLHPYGPKVFYVADQIKRTRRAMKRHGDRHTKVWISEIGWGSAHRDGGLNKGKNGQRKLLKQSFRKLRHKRGHWHLRYVDWFSWRDPTSYSGECHFCAHAGLFNPTGEAKPSWHAFKGFTR
jgi:hypothetical protein